MDQKHMDQRVLRQRFVAALFKGLRVVWPILSGLLVLIVSLGVAGGLVEGWSLQESVYFSFVSGLTIGEDSLRLGPDEGYRQSAKGRCRFQYSTIRICRSSTRDCGGCISQRE
jgi:hypothetical protein